MAFAAGPLTLDTEEATVALATRFAAIARPGDTFLLWGEIGAGKSTFARAFIRALTQPGEEVPSPTFTLVQTYDSASGELWHADLYRLCGAEEIIELGLADAFAAAICLVEWPDRLGPDLPPAALNLRFAAGEPAHSVTLDGPDFWTSRLEPILHAA